MAASTEPQPAPQPTKGRGLDTKPSLTAAPAISGTSGFDGTKQVTIPNAIFTQDVNPEKNLVDGTSVQTTDAFGNVIGAPAASNPVPTVDFFKATGKTISGVAGPTAGKNTKIKDPNGLPVFVYPLDAQGNPIQQWY